jgi:hypothetical protein
MRPSVGAGRRAMRRSGERGEGRFGTFVGLAVLAAVVYAAWNVAPVYIANYTFQDKVIEMARAPVWSHPDAKIKDLLIQETQELGIDRYINRQQIKVETRDHGRRITVHYERQVKVLPGFQRVFKFDVEADQPLL